MTPETYVRVSAAEAGRLRVALDKVRGEITALVHDGAIPPANASRLDEALDSMSYLLDRAEARQTLH